jgi:hypothetical protein
MGLGRFRPFDAVQRRRVFGHAFRRAGRTVRTVLEMDAGRLERRQVAWPSVSAIALDVRASASGRVVRFRRSCASPNTRRLDTCRFGLRHVSGAFRVTITLQQDVQFSNQYPIREAINSRDTHGERIGGHPRKDEEAENWTKDMNSRDCQREVECIDLPFCVKASGVIPSAARWWRGRYARRCRGARGVGRCHRARRCHIRRHALGAGRRIRRRHHGHCRIDAGAGKLRDGGLNLARWWAARNVGGRERQSRAIGRRTSRRGAAYGGR